MAVLRKARRAPRTAETDSAPADAKSVAEDRPFGEVDPARSAATRLMCRAVHARPDRIAEARAWRRAQRDRADEPRRPRRSNRRRIYLEGSDECPPLGESMARWVVDHVLHGPPAPVPSYGFDLVPVLTHSLSARRRRWWRRAGVLVAIGLLAGEFRTAALVWGIAVAVAAGVRWAALSAPRKGKRLRWAGSSRWAYAVLCIPLLLAAVPSGSADGAGPSTRLSLVVFPAAAAAAPALDWAFDRLGARAAQRRLSEPAAAADRLPWTAPVGRRRIVELGVRQFWPALPYDEKETFVGAGRDVWGTAEFNIPLKGKDPEKPVRSFGEKKLLNQVAHALQRCGCEPGGLSDPLPGLLLARVVGLPASLWLHSTRGRRPEPLDPGGRGRRSPSSLPDRLYLRAQCVTWDGQIVVSLFTHAAIEAGELRLTVRPQVTTPLFNEFQAVAAPLAAQGPRLVGRVAVQAVLDTVAGAVAVRRALDRRAQGVAPARERAEEKDPVSLRDRYSLEEVSDMHQSDDAKRHVVLMQSCIFKTVASYLKARGVDTALYERQVATVIANIQIYGDNNAPIQNVAGGDVQGVSQQNGI